MYVYATLGSFAGNEHFCSLVSGDSGQMMGNRCSNCIAGGFDCTHDQLQKVRLAYNSQQIMSHTGLVRTWALPKGASNAFPSRYSPH
jgi:hypothetical protein